MVVAQIVIYSMGAVLLCMNLFIGSYLLIRIRKTGLSNIYWLSAYFFSTVIEFLLRMAYIAGRPVVGVNFLSILYYIYNLMGHFFLIFFVKFTFYTERRSAFALMLVSTIIAKILYVITYILTQITLSLELYDIGQCFAVFIIFYTSLWLSYASFSAYHRIKRSEISPWIKKRYLIVGISAILLAAQSFPTILTPYGYTFDSPFMASLALIITLLNIIFAILSLIAWVMPRKLKEYFNRGYFKTEDEELSEEQLLAQVKKQLLKGGLNGDN